MRMVIRSKNIQQMLRPAQYECECSFSRVLAFLKNIFLTLVKPPQFHVKIFEQPEQLRRFCWVGEVLPFVSVHFCHSNGTKPFIFARGRCMSELKKLELIMSIFDLGFVLTPL